MKVVIISAIKDNHVVAIIENPDNVMNDASVALAWALSEGFTKFPTDCKFCSASVTPYGIIARRITPCTELQSLDEKAKVALHPFRG
jgi:hypothetical protein